MSLSLPAEEKWRCTSFLESSNGGTHHIYIYIYREREREREKRASKQASE